MNRKQLNYFAVFLVFSAFIDYIEGISVTPIHDVKYSLKKGERRTRQINYGGDSLIVGAEYDGVFGKGLTYRCTMQTNFNNPFFTNKTYDTIVMKGDAMNPRAEPSQANLLDYFHYVTREVWDCEEEEQRYSKFIRIVNAIRSHKLIFDLQFYDGISVQRDGLLGNEKHVYITEIKYYMKDKTGFSPMRYDGFMEYEYEVSPNTYFYPNFDIIYIDVPQKNHFGLVDRYTEIIYTDQGLTTYAMSDHGKILKIGSPPGPPLKNPVDFYVYNCREYNTPSPLHPGFRTEVYQELRDDSEIHYYARIDDEEFSKIFTIIDTKQYICTNQKSQFLRVENDVLGRSPIKAIHVHDGITKLLSMNIPGGKTVRFREIKYLDIATKTPITFKGLLRLFETDGVVPPKENNLQEGRIIDTKYLLRFSTTVSRTLINTEGYDLRIGSNVYGAYNGDKDGELMEYDLASVCFKDEYSKSMRSFDTIFKVKVNEDDEFHALHTIEGEENRSKYFKLLRRDVFFCEKRWRESSRLKYPKLYKDGYFRVVNVLEVLVPIREIETYDGVEIIQTNLANNQRSVKIVEKKYVNKYGHQVKIGVQMIFPKPNPPIDGWNNRIVKTLYDSVEDLFPTFELYPISDYYTVPNANLEAVIGGGPYVMHFAATSVATVGTADDLADCKLMENYQKVFYPTFTVSELDVTGNGDTWKTVDEAKSVEDSFAYNKYFQDLNSEVWHCTIREKAKGEKPPKPIQFLRIVSNLRLKKKGLLPYNIGRIFYSVENRVSVEMENENDVVKIRDVKHLDVENNYERLSFAGFFSYERKPRSGVWKSGTVTMLPNFGEDSKTIDREPKKVDYVLTKTHHFQAVSFYRNGTFLAIDSKWRKPIGNEKMIISCDIIANALSNKITENYQTEVKITSENGDSGDQNVFEEYFENLGLEVWSCKDEKASIAIHRVVHHFLLKPEKHEEIKSLLVFDGTKVMYDESVGKIEIAVLKYMDPNDYTKVKFGGKVQLPGNSGEIKAVKLTRFGVADLIYLHPENMHRTIISKKGMSFEIGSKYEIDITTDNTKPDHYTCRKDISMFNFNNDPSFFPTVVINNYGQPGSFIRLKVNKHDLSEYFTYTSDVWTCKNAKRTIRRVVNKLVKKDNVEIAVINHHEGVNVKMEEKIIIDEIKYMQIGFINQSRIYVQIKMNGFISFQEDIKRQKGFLEKKTSVKEMDYTLDTEYIYFQFIRQVGFTIEINSKWKRKVDTAENDVVTCEKIKKHIYDDSYAPRILMGSYLIEGRNVRYQWNKLTALKNQVEYFEDVNQRVWICKRNEEVIFYRVVNELIAITGSVASVYYGDGIEVGTLIFPDNSYSTMIREVKYIDPTDSQQFVRYDGVVEIITEMNSLIDKIYDGIPEIREEKLEIVYPDSIEEKRKEKKYWPLNTLQVYGRRCNTILEKLVPPAYDSKVVRRLNARHKQDGFRVIEMGQFWEDEYERKIQTGDFRCLLDDYNTIDNLRNPRDLALNVMEYSSNKIYLMDYERQRKEFRSLKYNMYICSNGDENLYRLDTVIEVDTDLITAIFFTDNMKIPKNIANGTTVIDQEYYIESTPKRFKYDAALPLIFVVVEPKKCKKSLSAKTKDFFSKGIYKMQGNGKR